MSSTDPFNQILQGFQGTAIPWAFTVKDSADAPMDVSGWIVMHTVKKSYDDTDDQAIWRKDVQMPDGSLDGKLSGETPSDVTLKMPVGTYVFDVRVLKPDSVEPIMLYAGRQIILRTVGTRQLPDYAWTPPT